jgi:hypothetical protein
LRDLFQAHQQDSGSASKRYSCEFYEVYNEKIKDLLVPAKSEDRTRKVHVHPKHGVRVENLNMSIVSSAEEVLQLVEFGNQMRAVATTTMNTRSSRSHAVFTFKYERFELQNADVMSCQSTATFVDLAGREDQSASQNKAMHFREMCCINTSLFHLANVITKLSQGLIDGKCLANFRNSKLTMLLSPALIGNSRTALIATVAPLRSYFDDSVCTLNFAASVKKIKTFPVINNKAPNTMVSELEAEVRQLQSQLTLSKTAEAEKERALLSARALIVSYKRSWEEALEKSHEQALSRQRSLKSLGLDSQELPSPMNASGELAPFLTKLSDDPVLQGHCNYLLRDQVVRIGSDEQQCAIVLQGLGILPRMCEVRVAPSTSLDMELVVLDGDHIPRVLLDGHPLLPSDGARQLRHGSCLFLGYSHAFRVVAATNEQAHQIGSTDACVLARATLQQLDLASAVVEIVDETGEQFKGILPYISHLSSSVGDDAVEGFVTSLHRICPLIDEANLITSEVCVDDGIRFELRALTNVFDFRRNVPEFVVCLTQTLCPSATSKRRSRTVLHDTRNGSPGSIANDSDTSHLLGKDLHPLVHAMGLSEQMMMDGSSRLLYVWSLEKFLWRLNAIREIYVEGSEAKDGFMAICQHLQKKPLQNPWREFAVTDAELLKDQSGQRSNAADGSMLTSPPGSPQSENLSYVSAVTAGTPDRIGLASDKCAKRTVLDGSAEWQALDPFSSKTGCTDSSDDTCSISSFSRGGVSISETEQGSVSQSRHSQWATSIGARVESLSAEVGQVQDALLRQRAMHVTALAASEEGIRTCSEDVSRWLRDVQGLRDMLGSFHNFNDDVHRAAASTTLLRQVQSLKEDVAQIVKESVKDQLECLQSQLSVGSTESTEYSSVHSSSGRSDNTVDAIVYKPKLHRSLSPPSNWPSCPASPGLQCTQSSNMGHADSPYTSTVESSCSPSPRSPAFSRRTSDASQRTFGPSRGVVRRPSPAPKREVQSTTLGYSVAHSNSRLPCSAAKSPVRSWMPATPIVDQRVTTLTKSRTKQLSPHTSPSSKKSTSPSRKFVGPFPKFSWAYYEVTDRPTA